MGQHQELPAISGLELIKLLCRNGWVEDRSSRHGAALKKYDVALNRTRWAIIPRRKKSLPPTVLGRILSKKQSGIGRDGLMRMYYSSK